MVVITDNTQQKQIYIVMSQTGTLICRLLKLITRKEYNHVSLSLSPDLESMYSFGRKNPYFPFWGGLVNETIDSGTFKRFPKTKALVLAVDISGENYRAIHKKLSQMLSEKEKYHYNYLGVLLAAIHISHRKTNCYYCSEFVKYILQEFDIEGAENLKPIVHPIHFLSIPHTPIYCGRLKDYTIMQ